MTDAVSKLTHIAKLLGWVVTVSTMPPEGPSHIPIVKVSIHVEGEGLEHPVLEVGEGQNKKIAKQAAATQLLLNPVALAVLQDADKITQIATQVAGGGVPSNPKQDLYLLCSKASSYWAQYPRNQPGLFKPVFTNSGLPGAFKSQLTLKLPDNKVCVATSQAANKRNADQQAAAGVLNDPDVASYLEPFRRHNLPLLVANAMDQDVYGLPPPNPLLLTGGDEPILGPESTTTAIIAAPDDGSGTGQLALPPSKPMPALLPPPGPAVPPLQTAPARPLMLPGIPTSGSGPQGMQKGPALPPWRHAPALPGMQNGPNTPPMQNGAVLSPLHNAPARPPMLNKPALPPHPAMAAQQRRPMPVTQQGVTGPMSQQRMAVSNALVAGRNAEWQLLGASEQASAQRALRALETLTATMGHAGSNGLKHEGSEHEAGGPFTPDLEHGKQEANSQVPYQDDSPRETPDGVAAEFDANNNHNGSDAVLGPLLGLEGNCRAVEGAAVQPTLKRQRVE